MSSNENEKRNAAYVALWKEKNPKLAEIKIEGNFLLYQNEKIDLKNIYMQDILINPNTFKAIETIEASDLFTLIKLHSYAIQVKEKYLIEKMRRFKEYEY